MEKLENSNDFPLFILNFFASEDTFKKAVRSAVIDINNNKLDIGLGGEKFNSKLFDDKEWRDFQSLSDSEKNIFNEEVKKVLREIEKQRKDSIMNMQKDAKRAGFIHSKRRKDGNISTEGDAGALEEFLQGN